MVARVNGSREISECDLMSSTFGVESAMILLLRRSEVNSRSSATLGSVLVGLKGLP